MGQRVKTITFADEGQDFLEFDLDAEGHVVDCRPFQGWLWIGYRVMNHAEIKPGDYAQVGVEKVISHVVTGVSPLNLEP